MIYTITIDDPVLEAGVSWARTEYNKSVPDGLKPFDDDQSYLQWLIAEQAAPSYAKQQLMTLIKSKVDEAQTAGVKDLQTLADKLA